MSDTVNKQKRRDLGARTARAEVRIAFKAFETLTEGIVIHPTALLAWPNDQNELAIDLDQPLRWVVTHAASGKTLARFEWEATAWTFAKRLGNGKVDWTKDEDGLRLSGDWEKIGRAIKKLREELGGEK